MWSALVDRMGRSRAGSEQAARVLGCREWRAEGDPGRAGSTIVGFRVLRAEPPSLLALGGRHRFSRYALTFAVEEAGSGRSRLRATTDAAFPGLLGRGYRALVIGSRMHVRAVGAILAGVRHAAERQR